MPILKKTLDARLDGLVNRFGPTAGKLRIMTRSDEGGAVTVRNAILASSRGEAIFLPTADKLDDIAAILESTPAFAGAKNAGVAAFAPGTADPVLQILQGSITDAIVTGVIGLGAGGSGRDLKEQIDLLLKTVLSVDDVSNGVRDLFSGRRGLDAHDIPHDLIDVLEKLQSSGCFAGVSQAMHGLAGSIGGATPSFDKAQQILSIRPIDACPGEVVHLEGIGFGATQDVQEILFTGAHHSANVVATEIKTWTNTGIDVVVPKGAGRGPVALAKPATNGADSVAAAAGALAGQLSACFGIAASGAVGLLQNMKTVPRVQPPMLGTNAFEGGPPEIKEFTLAGRTGNTIWPNGSLKLSWKVAGATKITIKPEQAENQANELPQIPGGQPPESGSYTVVNIPGSSNWTGAYRLVASNKCGTDEAKVDVVMARRIGLALSGGGARGAFQLGVLDYLYDIKGIRPDAIASTSVGSINAIQLVMGDDPAKNAVEKLKNVWLGLEQPSNMWIEEAWLTDAKQGTRDVVNSFGWWDIAFFPLTLPIHAVDMKSKIDGLSTAMKADGAHSFFNISPIESKMLAVFDQSKVRMSGIALRLISVSLETGEIVKVDEQGHVLASGGGTSTLINGAMASSAMPGIFRARRVGKHTCVDGGVREVIPVQYCIDDMGANEVYAIACSARTRPIATHDWLMDEVMTRSMMDIIFDEIVKDDIAPHGDWPAGVVVRNIVPRFNIFDAIMIEPGLIRLALDYGWMCAADELDTTENGKGAARFTADKMIQLRLQNWADRYTMEAVRAAPDPHSGFVPAISNGFMPPSRPQRSEIKRTIGWYVPLLRGVRDRCREIQMLAAERLAAGGALPKWSASWWQDWETIATTAQSETAGWGLDTPWKGITGEITTETPPPALV